VKKVEQMKTCSAWLVILLLFAGCSGRENHSYPSRPITLICPPAAGGLSDGLTRALAAAVQPHLGVPMVVENKPGGANAVGMTYGANARPDGYTVTYLVAELAILPHLHLSPIHVDQFELLIRTNYNPAAVTVLSDSPWRSLDDLVLDARAHPDTIVAGNSGTGSIWHLAAVSLQKASGVRFKHVPFGGAAPAVQALLGGHVQVVCVSLSEVRSQVEAGNLRVLAVMSKQREGLFPNVPTTEELGYALDVGAWGGLAVPRKTPPVIKTRLLAAFRKAFQDPDFIKRMDERGVRLAWLEEPAFGEFIQAQSKQNRQTIAELGLDLRGGDVGHRFFPILLSGLGVVLLLFRIPLPRPPGPRQRGRLRLWGHSTFRNRMPVLTLAYMICLPILGFIPSTALFLAGSSLVLKREALMRVTLMAIVGTALLWWLFVVLLKVPLT
jgi:tripartite-type tricarboxylate transporter receptor subunit TctC